MDGETPKSTIQYETKDIHIMSCSTFRSDVKQKQSEHARERGQHVADTRTRRLAAFYLSVLFGCEAVYADVVCDAGPIRSLSYTPLIE